jgi:hypothetical protein
MSAGLLLSLNACPCLAGANDGFAADFAVILVLFVDNFNEILNEKNHVLKGINKTSLIRPFDEKIKLA